MTAAATVTKLVYCGRLPRMNRQAPRWWDRYGLRQKCVKAWGVLPASLRATTRKRVRVVRVCGPRERFMDFDNLLYCLKGAMDSLTVCGYIRDDSPQWAEFTVEQDADRRGEGPAIEVEISEDTRQG